MALSLEEVEDLIDSWEFDTRVDTIVRATELLQTMAVGDPGRIDVLQVIADHHAMRGDVDAALSTLDQAGGATDEQHDVLQAMRVTFLIQADRGTEAEPELRTLRRRGPSLPSEAIERVGDILEEAGRLREAARWFTIGLRDLDPQHDLPEAGEEYALTRRMRVRQSLGLPPDHYDTLARTVMEERRSE